MLLESKNGGEQDSFVKVVLFLSLILSIITYAGVYYDIRTDESRTLLFFFRTYLMESIVVIALLMAGFFFFVSIGYRTIRKYSLSLSGNSEGNINRTLILYWLLVFCAWLPYLILCFPCSSMGWDYHWQLLQGSGVFPLSNHHPVLGSIIYGWLYNIGYIFGGAAAGLFFTGLVQLLLMSFAMAFSFSLLRKMGCSKRYLSILMIFTCLCPVFAGHSIWLIKDSIYSAFCILLFSSSLGYICHIKNKIFNDSKIFRIMCSMPVIIFLAILFSFYRNGSAIIAIVLFIILLAETCIYGGRNYYRKWIVGILIFFSILGAQKKTLSMLHVCPVNAREALCMVSASTVNYLKIYPTHITPEELAILQHAYRDKDDGDLQKLVERYNTRNEDGIKPAYFESREEVKDYLKVWIRLFTRHPGAFIDAFLKGSSGYWWMFYNVDYIWHPAPLFSVEEDFANEGRKNALIRNIFYPARRSFEDNGLSIDKTLGEYVTENNKKLEGLFTVRSTHPDKIKQCKAILGKLKSVPLVRYIFIPGFYTLLALLAMGYMCIFKRYCFAVCFPSLGILALACLSPVNGYMRYFLPIALFSLIMSGVCFTKPDNEQEKSEIVKI